MYMQLAVTRSLTVVDQVIEASVLRHRPSHERPDLRLVRAVHMLKDRPPTCGADPLDGLGAQLV
eukprot:COSAG01_NODE_29033_length_647_cov_0.828467_2_plen_63_part_01